MYAYLLQCGVDAERSEPGILLHQPDGVHDGEVDVATTSGSPTRLVFKALDAS